MQHLLLELQLVDSLDLWIRSHLCPSLFDVTIQHGIMISQKSSHSSFVMLCMAGLLERYNPFANEITYKVGVLGWLCQRVHLHTQDFTFDLPCIFVTVEEV